MLYDPNSLVELSGLLIDSNNHPLSLPGAYGIFCLDSKKWYIGISQNIRSRLKGHGKNLGKGHLRNALRKYGKQRFVFIPLLYSIDGTEWLGEQETELISQFDSARNGYNMVFADGRAGPYGEKFTEFVKAGLSSAEVRRRISEGTRRGQAAPGVIERMRAAAIGNMSASKPPRTDDFPSKARGKFTSNVLGLSPREMIAASTKRAWADPESRAKRMCSKLIASADPVVRQKISVATKKALNDPEVSARHSATVTGYLWITDGDVDRWIDPKITNISEGWRIGRSLLAARRWINDGSKTKMILPSDPIPEGWILGRKTIREIKSRRER